MRTRWTVALFTLLLSACTAESGTPEEPSTLEGESTMILTSPAFADGEEIPPEYTCDGADGSPELAIAEIPAGTASLALIMDDPDAPRGTWDHWVAYDIEPVTSIPADVETLGTGGLNSWGRTGYGGPCPPSGTHHYNFRLYALDSSLGLPAGLTKDALLAAMEGHVLAVAHLTGLYGR
jgi:Raf kinase inhibitor-like YbhB/YbcL family protein